jgi:CMP-N,N'-diacetyllegionaminic acid synthase
MKILGLIPARGGSKGIPGKNIKPLLGKPLMAYTFDSAKNSKHLAKLVLSSDDSQIIEVAKEIGLEVPFVRPAELATDSSPTLLVILHALQFFRERGEHFDAVCLLQLTSPFRRPGMIDEAIRKFVSSGSDSLVSVLPVPHEYNPHWVFEVTKDGFLTIATGEKNLISRRQELPEAFYRDGAIYLTKTKVLIDQKSLYGNSITYIMGDLDRHVNLDTHQDWEKAEQLVKILFPEV